MTAHKPYQLLDSGNRRRLELCGEHRLTRPAPQALWRPGLGEEEWRSDAEYIRSSSGGGDWRGKLPDEWRVAYEGFELLARPTGFGHLGIFGEQAGSWSWIEEICRRSTEPLEVLNLFAYTGGATMAAARGGARVCHVDASAGVVTWARGNAAANGLDEAPIRWICEEATKFCARELRRERSYDLIVLDPPSFGRGPKGEVFKIEQHLPPLLEACAELLGPKARGVLLSAHSPGFSPKVLVALVDEMRGERAGALHAEEMVLDAAPGGRSLPSGARACWRADS
ncbi:MAG: SAM-dependent methyltransferase [Gemmatimonadetes bacterium]|nr:SAM-dependent methyltransferase [Gemmatimonadota bacterium]